MFKVGDKFQSKDWAGKVIRCTVITVLHGDGWRAPNYYRVRWTWGQREMYSENEMKGMVPFVKGQ